MAKKGGGPPRFARYRGAENPLYRVEIHTGNLDSTGNSVSGAIPSFKWSRDNGTAVYPIVGLQTLGTTSTMVTLGNLGRDAAGSNPDGESE
jgi:hypothetical protein